jgi:stage III sporulation protein SpoIIIAA
VVGADLVTEPARPGVDHHAHLTGAQPKGLRGLLVIDLSHGLHLEEVVTRPQTADLAQAAVHRAVTDLRRVGTVDGAAVLTTLEISSFTVALFHGVPGATK